MVEGAFAGVGVGVTGSTAQTAQDNSKVFGCNSLAVGGGAVGGAITTAGGSSPHGPVNTAEVGVLGPGLGVGGASYNSNTVVANFNVATWAENLWGSW